MLLSFERRIAGDRKDTNHMCVEKASRKRSSWVEQCIDERLEIRTCPMSALLSPTILIDPFGC